jgi:hypothetical protein
MAKPRPAAIKPRRPSLDQPRPRPAAISASFGAMVRPR